MAKRTREPGRFVTLRSGQVIFIPAGKRSKWADVRDEVLAGKKGAGEGAEARGRLGLEGLTLADEFGRQQKVTVRAYKGTAQVYAGPGDPIAEFSIKGKPNRAGLERQARSYLEDKGMIGGAGGVREGGRRTGTQKKRGKIKLPGYPEMTEAELKRTYGLSEAEIEAEMGLF